MTAHVRAKTRVAIQNNADKDRRLALILVNYQRNTTQRCSKYYNSLQDYSCFCMNMVTSAITIPNLRI